MIQRMWRGRQSRKRGQAMVELALSITFICFLLAAAVDLGLAFKTYQQLVDATSEASSYLAENPLMDCSTCNTVAAKKSAANNVAINNLRFMRGEDTTLKGVGSLRDLNANAKDDVGTAGDNCNAACLSSGDWVQILEIDDSVLQGGNDMRTVGASSGCTNRPLLNEDSPANRCYILVRARALYKPFFPLAPAIGLGTVTVRAYAVKPITK